MDLIITFGLVTLVIMLQFAVVPGIILKRATKVSELNGYPIYMIESNDINAFSLISIWGKHILVTKGLLSKEDNEHIAAALMHEIGHIRLNHHIKMSLCIISIIIVFTYLLNYVIFLVPFVISVLAIQRYLQRRFELEADKFATKFINAKLLHDLITKYGENKISFLSTHPNIKIRLKNISK
ncbi:M48 family metalloprotease [Sulfolobus tengchongensis]|uniref:M48 family metalloprotease n=1 Tax=Sulfolobus tengchongensis TaxID=207809 RepID=A0AAX4KZN9_9CREN